MNLHEKCCIIEGKGAPTTSAKNDAAETCWKHESAANQYTKGARDMAVNDSTRIVPVGTDPNSNQLNIFKPLDIVMFRGEYRIVYILMRNNPRIQLRYYNGSEGFHDPVYVLPDELTPVGLAVL